MASSEPLRALLDVNVLISHLLKPNDDSLLVAIVRAGVAGRYVLLVPEALLEELDRAIHKSKYLTRHISDLRKRELADLLRGVTEPIPRVTGPIPALTRDPDDDYLLAYALVGRADYVVTGDRDLLALGEVLGVKIVRPRAFAALLASRSRGTG
jgi:uncharacterized protein